MNSKIIRLLNLFVGYMILSINIVYIIIPNNLFVLDLSGFSLIIKYLYYINPIVFISITSIFILIFFNVIFDQKLSFLNGLSIIIFPIVLVFFSINKINIIINNQILIILLSGFLYGISESLVKRSNYYYIELPKELKYIVLFFGTLLLSFNNLMSVIIIMYIANLIKERLLLGKSGNKLMFIVSDKYDEINNRIIKYLNNGTTLLKSENKKMIMCIAESRSHLEIKNEILKIDDKALIISQDCHNVVNGVKRKKLSFNTFIKSDII